MARTLLGRDSEGLVVDIALDDISLGTSVEGPTGAKGDPGSVGPEGPSGPAGPKGDRGEAGRDGSPGAQGEAGPQGPQGDIGPQGPRGADGPAGQDGAAGQAGAAGSQGETGPKGDRGEQGLPGAPGQDGAAGATGQAGPAGDKGDPGIQGPPGVAPAPVYAVLANGATAMGFGTNDVVKVTPTANATYTSTVPVAGKRCVLLVLTSGTSSRTITFGTGFKPTATLATGTATGRVFAVEWTSDGVNLYETGRTGAMTA